MNRRVHSLSPIALLVLLLAAAAAVATEPADDTAVSPVYSVTITNLTRGQVLSPPLAVTHSNTTALFRLGEPVLPELAMLAEDGLTTPLADLLATLPEVGAVGVASGPVPPGQSVTIELGGAFPRHRLSLAAMLVNTNDAFAGLSTVTLPRKPFQRKSFYALAYDSGSEANNEECSFIPGPACAGAGAGVRAPGGAEGFVHVHSGIHGVADLDPSAYDWRNPVALVVVQRVR